MEPISLVKGQKVDITKGTGLTSVSFGLGWDLQPNTTFDLDSFALPLKADDKPYCSPLYFGSEKVGGKPTILQGAIVHSGDNLTGAGDGDDEVITINTDKLPVEVEKVVIAVNIYNAKSGQNFGQVKSASCRAFDPANAATSIVKYDLNEDYSQFTAVVLGIMYKKDGEWKFQAVGEGKNGDINQICSAYGG